MDLKVELVERAPISEISITFISTQHGLRGSQRTATLFPQALKELIYLERGEVSYLGQR